MAKEQEKTDIDIEKNQEAEANKKKSSKVPVAQFVAIIALTISIFLIVDLGRRAAANYRIQREAEKLSQEVELARQHQKELQAQREHVASDYYAEEVARRELKWSRPGETIIVVLPTPETMTEQPRPETHITTSAPTANTPSEAWWYLFFGKQTAPYYVKALSIPQH